MKRALSLLLVLVMVLTLLPVTALAVTDSEPNDSIPTAQEFTICDTINGSISVEGGVDWYKFTLDMSGHITLEMTSFMPYYTLTLHNNEGTQLWYVEGKPWDESAGMRYDSYSHDLTEGTYYIKVTGRRYLNSGSNSTGEYVIKTDYVNANATEQEENDKIAQANNLPLYSSVNGQIAMNDEYDFYKIELPASGDLMIDMTAYNLTYNCLVLYNGEGAQIWYDEGNVIDASSGVRHEAYSLDLLGGIYYIRVSGRRYVNSGSNSTGTYTLAVDFVNANTNEVEPNNSIAEAQWVSPNKPIVAQIAMNDSKDFFQFTLTRDMALTLDFTSYTTYYTLQLYDEAGNRVWYDDNNVWDSSAQSRHDLYTIDLAKGTYTLGVTCSRYVSSGSTSTGNYTFKLNTENPFTDVPEGSFYYDPVLWAVERGITSGTTGTTFSPNDSCLRAHVVTFLWRAAGSPAPQSAVNPFVDVKPEDFYYKAVLWAVENGITTGADATHFNPFGVCNRAQVVTFLHRAMGSPAPTATANPFTDVPAGSFYYAPVLWAVENGITNGLSATEFGPNSACNRAQVVTFLYRAYN